MRRGLAVVSTFLAIAFVGSATVACATASVSALSPAVAGIHLERTTIPDLQQAMNRGQLSSVQLTSFYLQRIEALNPNLHAVITTNPDALQLAAESDARRRERHTRGAMDGIPVLVKDNIDTADKQATTAGSFALAHNRPARDAGVVTRLRDAGAVILGKANMSQWSGYRSVNGSSGWTSIGGQTNNPYVLDRNPCGSSSGSGVAVSAHLATVAVGTETDGSIVCPSGQNGIVGVKPSLGLVSQSGVVPITAKQDTAGPMARNVVDAAILLAALDGPDPRDPSTLAAADHVLDDYTTVLEPQSLQGKRIGVWRDAYGVTPETLAQFEKGVDQLRRLGATPVDISMPYIDIIDANEFPAIRTEVKHYLNAYLASTGGNHPADLAGLIKFNEDNAAVEKEYFAHELWVRAQATNGDLEDPAYQAMRTAATSAGQRGLDETLRNYQLDAIVSPTNNAAWKTQLGVGDGSLFVGSSAPAAVAGYANVTVPMGFDGALPLGMSFMAGKFSEPKLLALAYSFEQATQARRPPELLPTIG